MLWEALQHGALLRVAAAAKGGARRRERAAARGWARARAADSRVVAAAAPRPSRAPATAAASRWRAVAPSSPATPLSRGQTGTSSRRGTRWSGPTWRTVPSCTARGPLSAAVTAWRDGGRSWPEGSSGKGPLGWLAQSARPLPSSPAHTKATRSIFGRNFTEGFDYLGR